MGKQTCWTQPCSIQRSGSGGHGFDQHILSRSPSSHTLCLMWLKRLFCVLFKHRGRNRPNVDYILVFSKMVEAQLIAEVSGHMLAASFFNNLLHKVILLAYT